MDTHQPLGAQGSNNPNLARTGSNTEQAPPATNFGLWKPASAQNYLAPQNKTALFQINIQYRVSELTPKKIMEQRKREKELQLKREEEWEQYQEQQLVDKYDRIRNSSPSSLKRFREVEAPWMMSQPESRPGSAQSGRSVSLRDGCHSPRMGFLPDIPAQVIAEKLMEPHRSQSLGALSQAVQADASLAARTSLSESSTPLSSSPVDRNTRVREPVPLYLQRCQTVKRKKKPSPLSKD